MGRSWFMINDKLDRTFLRTSAVYRCVVRYGASAEWAVKKCSEVLPNADARALVEGWKSPRMMQDMGNARWRGEGDGRDEGQA